MVKSVRASFLSAQWIGTRHRERALWSMRIAARVTPTLMPGGVLTHTTPGTGQRGV